ncbi:MAG: dockerin type I repeat-containing protein, partial [Muribaculaceae bacterium]|nr:dockerin type I repeat-containing protein [Muribaculaceae bacterium]
ENDEGFGEQAFIKRLIWVDEEGNPLEEPYYEYEGMNYFFASGQMKVGFNIYIETENPFMTFNYTAENGEYEFPVEGGSYSKTFGEGDDAVTLDAIEIFSWYPSEDWEITTVDGEDVPDWLTLEPEDEYEANEETGEEEFSNLVRVSAEAAPLPEGVKGRECTVRFAVVGAELTYHFTQGDTSDPGLLVGDVNRDGRVNVSDVSALINMILGITEKDMETADVNGDGKVNVSDVSALINIILGITA